MSMTEPPETLPETEPPASDYVIEDGVRPEEPHLKRVIGFWGVTFYGLGGIIGAGIFATIGAISGASGRVCTACVSRRRRACGVCSSVLWRAGASIAQSGRRGELCPHSL